MLNYIWAALMLLSVAFGCISGRVQYVSDAMFSGASNALQLFTVLLSMMILWNGLMKIAQEGGVTRVLSKMLSPFLKVLFPGLGVCSPAAQAMSMNIAANILGLGNAATPLGLKAMEELQKENPLQTTASNHMVTFVVLNSVSVQLIPTGTAAIRAQLGAENPMDIMPAVWIASAASLIVGVGLAVIINKFKHKKTIYNEP